MLLDIIFLIFSLLMINFNQNKNFKELLRIGTEDKPNYMFYNIDNILTDKDNNIFVTEKPDMTIKKYNKNGKYIRTFGRKGKGPGEFLDFTTIVINSDNTIIIFDQLNARITYYSVDGKLLDTKTYSYSVMSWPRVVREYDKKYIILYNDLTNKKLLHLFNQTLDKKINSLPLSSNLFEDEDISTACAEASNFIILKNNDVLFVPNYYSGEIKLCKYKKKDLWNYEYIIKGYVKKHDAYTILKRGSKISKDMYAAPSVFMSGGKVIEYIVHNKSHELFQLKNGDIVHFTTLEDGRNKVFGYELFDYSYNFKSYNVIKNVPIRKDGFTATYISIRWKDKDDNFYFVENDRYPIIKKVQLSVN